MFPRSVGRPKCSQCSANTLYSFLFAFTDLTLTSHTFPIIFASRFTKIRTFRTSITTPYHQSPSRTSQQHVENINFTPQHNNRYNQSSTSSDADQGANLLTNSCERTGTETLQLKPARFRHSHIRMIPREALPSSRLRQGSQPGQSSWKPQPERTRPESMNPKEAAHDRDAWKVQKEALNEKFGNVGWVPRKKLSPDALDGIRSLHTKNPQKYSTETLADQFKISPEAIRRILKSKWKPTEEEQEDRRRRWDRRGEAIWSQMVELGVKPPKKWREMGISHPRLTRETQSSYRSSKSDMERVANIRVSRSPVSSVGTTSEVSLYDRIL